MNPLAAAGASGLRQRAAAASTARYTECMKLTSRMRRALTPGFSRKLRLLVGVLFTLAVLYPNPLTLGRSIAHTVRPDVDPQAARAVAATLPDDPRLIERAVLEQIVPYAYDWQSESVPWYFPTTAEVLEAGRGDCESRALVLASILDAKGIPYELRMSFDHIWVDYPGKQANAIENDSVVLVDDRGWRWPEQLDLREELRNQVAFYWTPMPLLRKVLLAGGITAIVGANVIVRAIAALRRRRARPTVALAPGAESGA